MAAVASVGRGPRQERGAPAVSIDHVGAPPIGGLAEGPIELGVRIEHSCARAAPERAPGGQQIGAEDGRPGKREGLDEQTADRPEPDDDHRVARLPPGSA